MMKLYQYAKDLESKLNSAITNTADEPQNLNTFLPDTRFKFRIYSTSGEYEKAKVNGNTVTYYINGVLRQTGSDKEGTVSETYSASISAVLDLVVPRCDLFKTVPFNGTEESYGIYNAVEDIIDDTLRLNQVTTFTDEDENGNTVKYFLSIGYEIAVAGVRDIRGQVGDSLPMTVMLDFGIVADGVSSSDVIYEILNADNGTYERIYPSTVGIARNSVQEGNIPSDTDNGISYSTTNGSNIVLTFARTVRYTYLDKRIAQYTLLGYNEPIQIRITYPLGSSAENIRATYNMTFAQGGLNGLEGAAMSSEIKLVEELE